MQPKLKLSVNHPLALARQWLGLNPVALALALALMAGGCAHHERGPRPRHVVDAEGHGLTVVGTGEAKGTPDIARTSVGIEVRADTAALATAQANERMTAILAAIKGAGVAETDLRTHDFSVQFERDYTPVPPPQPAVLATPGKASGKQLLPAVAPIAKSSEPRGSYRVSNTAEVTVRDVLRLGAVLSAATNAGANNVYGISFDVSNQDPLHEKAREQAIARAKHSAQELARLTGVKLGTIITIEDQADSGQVVPSMYKAAMAATADSVAVPAESGELTITHQVRLVYDLDK